MEEGGFLYDSDAYNDELQYWLDINTKYSEIWPGCTQKIDPMPGADDVNPEMGYTENKTNQFSTNPGPEE